MTDAHFASPAEDDDSQKRLSKGQLRRRRAILDAACALLSRMGEDGMTMRAIAAEADVSPTTPYNLFGTKEGILLAIYAEDLDKYKAYFEAHASKESLSKIFDLVDLSIAYCNQRPDFLRSLYRSLIRNAGSVHGAMAWSALKTFMHTVIVGAIEAGVLWPDAPSSLLAEILFRLSMSVCQEWIDNIDSLSAGRDFLGSSFVLALRGYVTPKWFTAFEKRGARYRLRNAR